MLFGYLLIQQGFSNPEDKYSAVYLAIGTSMIAAGIVAILELWKEVSAAHVLARLRNVINEAGIEWVYRKRDIDKYDDLMAGLNGSLDIAGYSLGGFFDSYSEILKQKLKFEGVRARVLLVDPCSEFAKSRARVEGKGSCFFHERARGFLSYFENVDNIEIRFLDDQLTTMYFRIDKKLFVGPHMHAKQSKATLTFELNEGHWLHEEYVREFERLWGAAKIAKLDS
ncbi:hypothetical protein [Ectothiorhodospira variabilis]|uniref:hypothetical protein n=1 Tax=Ectothiorhodospira variabilis TaxID=505694 RepID=UPI001EFAA383|nr:hypothetical protein [Ectothiorhodospira variabilis]MCG5493250.1 hypothetical protein [Ectothiorhodospira variabilis]MCG5502579.1 hypothetical protein [Ectothiorhodospira variabilis]MCG5505655.1 hypothetical protein [Ectothiorhodospira variabilis]